jgi:HSP20 family protein
MRESEDKMKLIHTRPILPELSPWSMMVDVPSRFNRLFEDYFGPTPAMEQTQWNPAIDITDADGELLLSAELPGLEKKDVQLTITDGVLTLKGEKNEEREEKDAHYRVVERRYGAFERSFTLPGSVDINRVKAEFKDGVLKVHMPKAAAAVGKKVEISAK